MLGAGFLTSGISAEEHGIGLAVGVEEAEVAAQGDEHGREAAPVDEVAFHYGPLTLRPRRPGRARRPWTQPMGGAAGVAPQFREEGQRVRHGTSVRMNHQVDGSSAPLPAEMVVEHEAVDADDRFEAPPASVVFGVSEALREAARLPAVRAAIGQETARLAQSPSLRQGISWTGDEPLVAGDHIAWRAGGTVHHAAVAFPGDAGGMRASDTLLLRIAGPADGTALDDAGRIVEIGAQALWDGGCARAAWSEEGLRQLEAARQYSVPSAACRLACSEPVEGDRIAWTEAAGRTGEVRTIEAVVATRTETPDRHEIALRTIRASGPGAPEPGGSIQRTAEEVTARGCFRAPWSDEARRERILDPPKEVQERTLTLRRERSHGGGIGM